MGNSSTYNFFRAGIYILPVLLLLLISSCFKEKPLAKPDKQGLDQTNVISMGPDYADQYFYSLKTNSVISHNSRFAYDLMFDCADGDYYMWLNSAKFMCALKTHKKDFNSVTLNDTVGGNWLYELGSYNIDSCAMGYWYKKSGSQPISDSLVYIINMGVDLQGNALGFVKLQLNGFYGGAYSITYASLTGADSGTLLVPKDPTRNYKYVALTGSGQIVDGIEPEKSLWDLCFTHYTIIFYEPYYLPYQVTGVLSNPSHVSAYVDSAFSYNNVTIANFNSGLLQTNRDAVGYQWKVWNGTNYNCKGYYVYFIKTDENIFYKLHFLDFNKDGVKGYPTFEFEQL